MMVALFEVYDKEATENKIAVYWSLLKTYNISKVRLAANAWVKKSEFMPKPADLIKILGGLGHISADEAWAIAIAASDESSTVVWTREIAKAWSLAEIIYKTGDRIGARRTFIDAYERLIDDAIINNIHHETIVSLGTDKELRIDALSKAVNMGMLTKQQADFYLPKPYNTLAMLENKKSKGYSMNHIEKLRAMISEHKSNFK